jgi:hypothetical protein
MEAKLRSKDESPPASRAKDLRCWSTATSAQCLRVETPGEIHLFPYGYFEHAKFVTNSGGQVLSIRFRERVVTVSGKNLESLCGALERLAVDCIRIISHPNFSKSEGLVEKIEIQEPNLGAPRWSVV